MNLHKKTNLFHKNVEKTNTLVVGIKKLLRPVCVKRFLNFVDWV